MRSRANPNAPVALLYSWLAAASAGIIALILIATGQDVGAAFAGCRWIGLSLPIHRQTWAWVNQPSLAFSGTSSALGYWFGGALLCLLVAALAVPLMPRPKTLAAELAAVQCAVMAAAVGLGWMALVDPRDGHMSHWLRLHDLSPALVWVLPVLGSWAALVPAIRLLALARDARPDIGRAGRVFTVILHLFLPSLAWAAVGTFLIASFGPPPDPTALAGPDLVAAAWPPALATLLPAIAAMILAWVAYPRRWAHQSPAVSGGALVAAAVLTGVLIVAQIALGGPTVGGRCRSLLWGRPDSRNNIRAWAVVRNPGTAHDNGRHFETTE